MKIDYDISDVQSYINWDYFLYAWGMHNKPEAERQKLLDEALQTLGRLQGRYHTHALFLLFGARSEGDDVVVIPEGDFASWKGGTGNDDRREVRLPFLRQQQPGSGFLCLADFIAPQPNPALPSPENRIGVFATSVDHGLETDFDRDPYQKMMVQLLADRLAEATAECLHESVRKDYWGYAPDERLTMQELHAEKFQGTRPAVGYPSLPDTSFNFLIDDLLGLRQIGIRLTESGAMKPHASVSGLMFSHSQAHYFALGKIGTDQLHDYARRRGLPVEIMRKFLSANL